TIVENLKIANSKGLKAALATVVKVYGSSYRRPGARMLIREDGFWFGSVSGGCLEGDVISKAKEVMKTGKSQLFKYDTRQNAKNAFGMGYGCNGLLEILIEPIDYNENNQSLSILNHLLTVQGLQGLSTIYYSEDDEITTLGERYHSNGTGFIRNAALAQLVENDLKTAIEANETLSKTYKIDSKKVKVLHEVFQPKLNILIYGAVFHVIPFMRIANELGYNVHVTDSFDPIQPVWNFPNSDEITIMDEAEVNVLIENTPNLAVVFLTHNFFYIKEELPKVLKSDAPYIGILGSRKKTQKILREAEVNDDNYSTSELAKIHYPIGLDIGANTPEEIALSIIAEIRAFFSNKTGESLKKSDGFIHKKVVTGF
ncbi:MAG: XdhC family protein, partial [Cyclobacteriaceae bacterium]|nr:XdhC family protein [Cyclobacteriaceae bacterium]